MGAARAHTNSGKLFVAMQLNAIGQFLTLNMFRTNPVPDEPVISHPAGPQQPAHGHALYLQSFRMANEGQELLQTAALPRA